MRDPARNSREHLPAATGQQAAGLVIVNYGRNLLVEDNAGELLRCVTRRGLPALVCGDRVEWSATGPGEGVVEELHERDTVISRAGNGGRLKPLAANVDRLVVEVAGEPAPDRFLIDKYCIAAELAGIEPVIVINKSDLLGSARRREMEQLLGEYHAFGYHGLFTSALENTGIDAFRELLTRHTSILVGQSGVGKSSLVGRLLPDQDVTVGALSAASGLGRHTTTATTLYHLHCGGHLIDSPGVRDFRPGHFEPAVIASGFREFRPYLGNCRFNDCLHLGEPGCAVLAALEAGVISARRMASYRQLLRD